MELRHLRYFCAVADHGSLSRAGQMLHVSQSAISEQLIDLEREVGGELLDRNQRRTQLTQHGRLFLAEARKTLVAADRAMEVARRSFRGEIGTLAIGFFLWGAGDFFSRIIREYRRLQPDVKLSIYEMHTHVQMEAMASGKIDAGFTRPLEPPFDKIFRSELLYRDPVVLAMPREHRLAVETKTEVAVSALAEERFVMCERQVTPALFDSILALCSSAGFSPEIVHSSSTWSSVLALVESGEGIALVPSGCRYLATPGIVFRELTQTTHVGISLAWNPEREGPILDHFLTLVRRYGQQVERGTKS